MCDSCERPFFLPGNHHDVREDDPFRNGVPPWLWNGDYAPAPRDSVESSDADESSDAGDAGRDEAAGSSTSAPPSANK